MWEYNGQHCRSIINHGGGTHPQHNTRGRHSPLSLSREEGHPWPHLTPACFHCTFVHCLKTARKKLRYTKALLSLFTPCCSVLASINIFYLCRFCCYSSLDHDRIGFRASLRLQALAGITQKSFFDFLFLAFKLSSRVDMQWRWIERCASETLIGGMAYHECVQSFQSVLWRVPGV